MAAHAGASLRKAGFRLRPLQGDERPIQPLDLATADNSARRCSSSACLARSVDHEQQMVAAVGDHQIVENAALRIGEEGIALPSGLQPEDVHRNKPFERRRRIGEASGLRPQRDLPHM